MNRYMENHLINGMSRTTGGSLFHALSSRGEWRKTPSLFLSFTSFFTNPKLPRDCNRLYWEEEDVEKY